MSSVILVRSNHAGVTRLVREWVADARLPLAAPVTLDISVGQVPPPRADRPALTDPSVVVRSASAGKPVEIEWIGGKGLATIEQGSAVARIFVREEVLEEENTFLRSFLLDCALILLRRAGLHHIHGATLCDPRNRGWLLVGVSRSGKSTTTARLAHARWAVGTDDISFLSEGDTAGSTRVVAWRDRLALREHARTLANYDGGTELDVRGKRGWFPEELGTTWVSAITPQIIAFPSIGSGSTTTVAAISAPEAMKRLIVSSPWVMLEPDLADENLALMNRLVTGAKAYDLQLAPDFLENPDLLMELTA